LLALLFVVKVAEARAEARIKSAWRNRFALAEILNNVPVPATRNAAGGVGGASMVEGAGLRDDDRMVGGDVGSGVLSAAGDQAVAGMAGGGCDDAAGSVICGAVAGC
jgi:hypothetical protein